MNAIGGIGGSIVALALLAGSPQALAQKPIRIDLAPLSRPAPATRTERARSVRVDRRSFTMAQPEVIERDRRLIDRKHARQDAISTLGVGLLTSEPVEDDAAPATIDGAPTFKFKKQGHLARDLRRGYRRMGERLADRVFEEPRGKRIVFDIEGKPGVGVEIPIR